MDEVKRLSALAGSEINEAKKVLATEITAMLHGRAAAEQAAETARKTFEEGSLADDLPTVTIPQAALEAGIGILALFVTVGQVGPGLELPDWLLGLSPFHHVPRYPTEAFAWRPEVVMAALATAVLAAACNPDSFLPPDAGLAGSDEVITSVPDEGWDDDLGPRWT